MSSFQNPVSMVSEISSGIKVTVEASYQEEYSNLQNGDFTFAYRITIENINEFPVRLLSRHWHIFDSSSQSREVEGDGVVGDQPILSPGEKYQYISGCHLESEMGKMEGEYLMVNTNNHNQFFVRIPEFEMIVPFKLN